MPKDECPMTTECRRSNADGPEGSAAPSSSFGIRDSTFFRRSAFGLRHWRRWCLVLLVPALAALAAGGYAGWLWWTARLLRQAEATLAGREYGKAREQLARYLAVRPGDGRAHLLAARAARRLRQDDEARQHLRLCRETDGPSEAVAVEYALLDVQQGDDGTVPALRERARKDDELALQVLEVLIQYDLDTYLLRQAQQDLTLYLDRRPDDLQALLGRGSLWERLMAFADAREDYRRAVAAHPDSERARLRLADTLLISGTPAEALAHYEWLLARRPGRPEARLGLARCRRQLGDSEEARRLLDALLAEFPEDGQALWERGQLELEASRPAEAEPWLQRAVRALPFDRRVLYSLSRCLLDLGRRQEAEGLTARVARLDGDVRRLGQLQQEVQQRPDDAALRCEGGLIFLRNGECREGIRWLRLALRLDPHCGTARAALAKAEADEAPVPP
jgi:tetratricopeptide (TPR) repeat protein